MLRAIIYDLDGTLIDSRADLAGAVNATLSTLELPAVSREQLTSFIGGGAELLVRRALAAARGAGESAQGVPADEVARALPLWHAYYAAHLLDETRLYPGIAELVGTQTIPQAVLTNKPGGYSRRILAGLGLERAFARVLGGDEAARKPDPRGLLSLCESLGASPESALLVGDSHIDVETGRAAGVPVCAVCWGFSGRDALEAARPAHLVDDVGALRVLLARL